MRTRDQQAKWSMSAAAQRHHGFLVQCHCRRAAIIGFLSANFTGRFLAPYLLLSYMQAQRMTPQRKRQQMLALAQEMGQACDTFNTRLGALQQQKHALQQELGGMVARMQETEARLGVTGGRSQNPTLVLQVTECW